MLQVGQKCVWKGPWNFTIRGIRQQAQSNAVFLGLARSIVLEKDIIQGHERPIQHGALVRLHFHGQNHRTCGLTPEAAKISSSFRFGGGQVGCGGGCCFGWCQAGQTAQEWRPTFQRHRIVGLRPGCDFGLRVAHGRHTVPFVTWRRVRVCVVGGCQLRRCRGGGG